MPDGSDVLLRQVNARIQGLTPGLGRTSEYLCECGHVTCARTMIALHPAVFREIVAISGARVVAPGHETPGSEIVREGRGYRVVRERGL
jgi:hypothetical protein